jgi:hypothetical protein
MNRLLVNTKGDFIDLYFNDMVCLKNTYKIGNEYRKSSLLDIDASYAGD